VYSDDEVFTSIRLLGSSEAEWVARSYDIVDAAGLRELLHPGPASPPSTVFDTVHGLVTEDPQHSPLYYVAAHFWIRAFGDSIAATRSFSAVVGLLVLPAAYWLCIELFGSIIAARIAVALYALSPVLVLYSQEAREYSLWAVAILAMSAAFLRAVRLGTVSAWAIYVAAFAFGLYVDPLSGLVALGQAVYIAALEWKRPRALVRPFAALAIGFLCFTPWLSIMIARSDQIHRAWATVVDSRLSPAHVARFFFGNLRRDFIDFDGVKSARLNVLMSLPVIGLIAYSAYFLCRYAPSRVWGYVVAIAVCTAVPLVLQDMLFSGSRTQNVRYFFPFYLSIDLAITYLIFSKIAAPNAALRQAGVGQLLLIAILAGRLASCVASSGAETWWNKLEENDIALARTINASDRPFVISDNYISWAVSLGIYLDPKTRVELHPRCYLCSDARPGDMSLAAIAPSNNFAVFLLGPSAQLQERVQALLRGAGSKESYACIEIRRNCTSSLQMYPYTQAGSAHS